MKMLFQLLPALLAVGVGGYALFRGTDVFSALTDGALQGLRTVGRIAPVLVCLLPAVGALRASGAVDAFTALLRPAVKDGRLRYTRPYIGRFFIGRRKSLQ